MAGENGLILVALAVGAYYFLFNKGSGPTYYDIKGNVITSIKCGNAITFDVPGNKLVWLTRVKNGVQDFNGPYAVPIPPYILSCSADVGNYTVTAYDINPDHSKGALIGTTNFTVTAS